MDGQIFLYYANECSMRLNASLDGVSASYLSCERPQSQRQAAFL
jgi:hypothetical protein